MNERFFTETGPLGSIDQPDVAFQRDSQAGSRPSAPPTNDPFPAPGHFEVRRELETFFAHAAPQTATLAASYSYNAMPPPHLALEQPSFERLGARSGPFSLLKK